MTLELLRELARHEGDPGAGAPVVRLERDEDVTGLVFWFGEDKSRVAAKLVIEGEHAGWLRRSDIYDLVARRRLGPGAGDQAVLPGTSTQWQVLELVCPTPGCPESPGYALGFDAAKPPTCPIHHQPLALS